MLHDCKNHTDETNSGTREGRKSDLTVRKKAKNGKRKEPEMGRL